MSNKLRLGLIIVCFTLSFIIILAPLAPVMAQVFAALRDRSYLSLFRVPAQSQLRECRIFSRAPGLGNGG